MDGVPEHHLLHPAGDGAQCLRDHADGVPHVPEAVLREENLPLLHDVHHVFRRRADPHLSGLPEAGAGEPVAGDGDFGADGISHFQNFWQIVLPLSKPIIAVMCLYYGVGHWNDYWKGMIYLNDQKLYPLQLILRGILTLDQIDFSLLTDYEEILRLQSRKELIKYGIIIVSTVPMLVIYPFLQKYFVKGVMIGSLKG